jgi:hypothetical protein
MPVLTTTVAMTTPNNPVGEEGKTTTGGMTIGGIGLRPWEKAKEPSGGKGGKYGGKGGKYGGGKGGKGRFAGNCHNCGKPGHKAADCRVNVGSNKGKGGKGKGGKSGFSSCDNWGPYAQAGENPIQQVGKGFQGDIGIAENGDIRLLIVPTPRAPKAVTKG